MSKPVESKERLVELIHACHPILQACGVKRLGLFGSFVRDEQQSDSDVDLLIEFEPAQKSFDNFMRVATTLEELTGRRVELVTRESLSPYLGPHILKEVEYVS